ncbi:MAG: tail fiber domain-containing protein [Chitinophagaceae bacterium]|nr:tail fiber domain-containing protein [Chitinophagaceae bacterium]
MKKQILLLLATFISCMSMAQNVGIGTTTPDASAKLDITSTDKGILIPRMNQSQRDLIATPATGLLIYQTDNTPGFYYYNGSAWAIISGSGSAQNWSLTGNSGTDPNTQFLGTTDNQPLLFKVNNQLSGKIDQGLRNSFWGYLAGNSNTTGSDNTANGFYALHNNTDGSANTANGGQALYANTTGFENTANGFGALYYNTTGTNNTANGFSVLNSNTEGLNNTAIGAQSLYTNTTGSGNTALGYGADVSDGGLFNATAIGSGAIVNASNKIRLGNTAVTVIEGQVAYSFPSDARFKYNIKNNVPGLDFITRLKPVTYYFDTEKLAHYTKTGVISNSNVHHASYTGPRQLHTGFLAQDVEKIAKELGYDFDGIHAPDNDHDHYSLAYSQFIMPLVKAVQQQQNMIKDLENTVKQQQDDFVKQLQLIQSLQKEVHQLKKEIK